MRPEGYCILPMVPGDVSEVAALEVRIFPSPWSAGAFRHELTANPFARSWVVRDSAGDLAGYACVWVRGKDLLLNTLAVAGGHRRRGVGRFLLERLLEAGTEAGCRRARLEVRPSNRPACGLYRVFGFEQTGRRPSYYSDGEDALVLGFALPEEAGG